MRDIKRIVNRIVRKYHTSDLRQLCDYLNVLVQVGDLGDVFGCYLLVKRQKCILINKNIIGTPMEKVVLAHELGHSVLHWKNSCYFYGSTFFLKAREEKEANIFAAELLISDSIVLENPGMTKCQLASLTGYEEKL